MNSGWGGKRVGAGRPKRGAIASEPHKRRPALSARVPVHVTARVVRGAGALHDRHARRAIARAVQRSLGRADFRIVGLAIVAGRLELVVEAADRHALARGMQGFQVAAARHLNRLRDRSGPVFPDRYRARPLLTRDAVRALVQAPIGWIRHAWPETAMLVATLLPPPPTPPPVRDAGRYP
jgi:hypothetical protein